MTVSDLSDLKVWIDKDEDGTQDAGEVYTSEIQAIAWRVGVEPGQFLEDPDYTYARITLYNANFAILKTLTRGLPVAIMDDTTYLWRGFIKSVDFPDSEHTIIYAQTMMAYTRAVVDIPLMIEPTKSELVEAILAACPLKRYNWGLDFILGPGTNVLPMILMGPDAIAEYGGTYSLLRSSMSDGAAVVSPYAGDWQNESAYSILFDIFDTARDAFFYVDEEGMFNGQALGLGGSSPVIAEKDVIRMVGTEQAGYYSDLHIIFAPRVVGSVGQVIYSAETSMRVGAGEKRRVVLRFRDPDERGRTVGVLDIDGLTYTANTAADGTGTNVTSGVFVTIRKVFGGACQILVRNTTGATAYVRNLELTGQPLIMADDVRYEHAGSGVYKWQYGYRLLVKRLRFISEVEDAFSYAAGFFSDVQSAALAVDKFRYVTLRGAHLDFKVNRIVTFNTTLGTEDLRSTSIEVKLDFARGVYETTVGLVVD